MTRKPWPASDSEFVVPDRLLEWCLNLRAQGLLNMSGHVAASVALIELQQLHDRYCTAAGFRE